MLLKFILFFLTVYFISQNSLFYKCWSKKLALRNSSEGVLIAKVFDLDLTLCLSRESSYKDRKAIQWPLISFAAFCPLTFHGLYSLDFSSQYPLVKWSLLASRFMSIDLIPEQHLNCCSKLYVQCSRITALTLKYSIFKCFSWWCYTSRAVQPREF